MKGQSKKKITFLRYIQYVPYFFNATAVILLI